MTITTRPTLAGMLADLVQKSPDSPVAMDVADGEVITLTRSELARRVEQLREELSDIGVRRGQCLAAYLPNWSDALVWQFAASAVGAHVIGVNTRYNVGEVAHILNSARPVVVAVPAQFHGLDIFGTLRDASSAADPVPAIAVVPGPLSPTATPSDFDLGAGAWIAGSGDTTGVHAPATPSTAAWTPAGERAADTGELGVAFTTSGSTGTPKLAAHRDCAVVRHAHADSVIMDVREGDVVLGVLPVSGVFGFSTAMAGLAGGAAILMEPVFDAVAALDRVESLRVTHIVGGDDLFGRLYDTWHDGRRTDLSSLRWLGIADFLGRSHDIARWARDEAGAETTGVFGSSEVFALALLWSSDDPESLRWNGGGRPVEDAIEVRVVDPFDDRILGADEEGELQFRGPNVVDAYLGNPEAATRAFTTDGWFRSGDLARTLGTGGFRYVCRMGDVLRLRGFLVDPAEIEHRLAEHENVQTAKVVGVTGSGGYTEAVSFVVPVDPDADLDAASLKAWCRDRLAAFKVPAAVHVIEEMPTTVGGNGTKIRAVELRDWAQRWSGQEVDYRKGTPA
ncbi:MULTISPECIES: AMP-binding protein [Gordonia]|uniref:Long-chain-fatty-acid--CoA ligase n=1 Tax=Gordonia amicalis TaxID=89053 RepID=A0AAE4R402_9ACTN|nr:MULTISPECIES: AMP-binding protein [Gordonia]ATD72361.1 acyl-CoA synthetase [Gordonia sp. 1D]MCZ4578573.1 AMP-binding protein [Gordonia amicalis]MCZ4651625.1 AMP-binding protein [Gordonia amicalis]MDJ0452658.1 AMP-binding protein [Gordonia amicalis]MDV6307768.1 AMP-binding protein [Gordonia amicalis]